MPDLGRCGEVGDEKRSDSLVVPKGSSSEMREVIEPKRDEPRVD